MWKPGRRALAVAAILVMVVGAGAAFLLLRDSSDEPDWTSAAAAVFPGGSCKAPAPDLGFSRLPALREPAFDGSDRFSQVLIDRRGRIVETGDYYEVALADEAWGAPRDWQVKGWMRALDERGRVVEEISHDKAAHGKARLALSGRRFRPGEVVQVRLENLGSEAIPYGYGIGLERETPRGWKGVPREYAVPLVQLIAEGGEVGICERLGPPPRLSPGHYRVTKEVSTYAEPRGYTDHLLTAKFEVVE
jgi:hypothetical protein